MQGIIKVLKDGFGFIKTEEGDMFFHANNLENVEYDDLAEGMTLSYEVGEGRDGRPQAINVNLVEEGEEEEEEGVEA